MLYRNKNEFLKIINEPFLPDYNGEYAINNYHKSKYNLSHPRYHFQDKYRKRKIFKINYSHYPYLNVSKNLSFEDNAILIYNSTGMLNITKLEYYYNESNNKNQNIALNHIHLGMSLDKNYTNLALISIASVLNSSNIYTYIHFHILGLNFGFFEIKNIIDLRKINKHVEFIFYNAKQAEYDFEKRKNERRGLGNYAKILCPQIINNTNKVLILDSGDILCQKDLSEIFFYDIEDNYFGWILEACAGNIFITEDKFMNNNFHPNTGVLLVNTRLFRKDELYKKSVFVSKSYHYFKCPTQDILITVANYKFKYIPLNYNLRLYFENETEKLKKKRIPMIKRWMKIQRFSPYKYRVDELLDAMIDPVIYHFYMDKIQYKSKCNKFVLQWLQYAKITGMYNNLKKIYPKPFKCEKDLY